MRRLEVVYKESDSQSVNLTINDSRITVKIPRTWDTARAADTIRYARGVASRVPMYRYPTLRGSIFEARWAHLRDASRKVRLTFNDKEA